MNGHIYVAGKITGDPRYRTKFSEATSRLLDAGYTVTNPADAVPADWGWGKAMKAVLGYMLRCDGVALLPDWRESRGAKIEERLAREVGMEVRPLEAWL